MPSELAILNIRQVASPPKAGPLRGKEMSSLEIKHDVNIAIDGGKISYVGQEFVKADQYIDGSQLVVIPGFVDCHTHIPFVGSRSGEFIMRLSGKSYMDIMKAGGGIRSTVKEVRKASATRILAESLDFLDSMLTLGVTTVEGKSGYGLDRKNELKQLKVLRALDSIHPVDVVPTFLGAHAVTEEYRSAEEFLDLMAEMFDDLVGLTDTIDIFCENGVFDEDQSRQYLMKAKEKGFKVKLHADELSASGGGRLAVELGAISADHLISADDETLALLAESETVATLLPGTSFFLNEPFAKGRKLIDLGAIVAIASDFNPGSCNIFDPFFIIFLAVSRCGLSVEEAINAYTANSAKALCLENKKGRLEVGYDADMVLIRAEDYREIVYNFSMDLVEGVIKNGNRLR
ncbi:MAG TPA: imidazolonepropionase [Mesotoga infera]|jgi:imidazolonepropionase|uniref:Imidazolonepropionase n=1 Tax=Mesotoga infera TaxID=1236046 RepID=A0A101IA59_9BACT|nr:MAG: Imidazolonepropionase [Mesotoga infera]KUK91458.1 MAG: Imidazolonepropionase [Mesotoga infera]HCO70494.1 imidazolonepropionase [Mesotoga infera]